MKYLEIVELSPGKYKGISNDSHDAWVFEYFDSSDISYISTNAIDNAAIILFKDNRPPWEINLDGSSGNWRIESIITAIPTTLEEISDMLAALKLT